MRVVTATTETQGFADTDYSLAVDGELVQIGGMECCADCSRCERGFPGLASAKSSTTAVVVDLPHMTPELLRQALADSLAAQGRAIDLVEQEAHLIEVVANRYPPGTVLEKDRLTVTARLTAPSTTNNLHPRPYICK